jgi:hypothetical protein
MAQALIKFTQGTTVFPAGEAAVGVLEFPLNPFFPSQEPAVLIENNDNTGVTSWKFELVDVPIGSVWATGVLSSGTVNKAWIIPDVPGSYRIKLTTFGGIPASDEDIRVFSVPNKKGWIIPPYQKNPDKLDDKPDELNFDLQSRGYADGEIGLLGFTLNSISDYQTQPFIPDSTTLSVENNIRDNALLTSLPVSIDGNATNLWVINSKFIYVPVLFPPPNILRLNSSNEEAQENFILSGPPIAVSVQGSNAWVVFLFGGNLIKISPGVGITESVAVGSSKSFSFDVQFVPATGVVLDVVYVAAESGIELVDATTPTGPTNIIPGPIIAFYYEPSPVNILWSINGLGDVIAIDTTTSFPVFGYAGVTIDPNFGIVAANGKVWSLVPASTAVAGNAAIFKITASTGTVEAVIDLGFPETDPIPFIELVSHYGMAHDSANNRIWTVLRSNLKIVVVDAVSNLIIKYIDVESFPVDVAYINGFMYVTITGTVFIPDGVVLKFDPNNYELIETIRGSASYDEQDPDQIYISFSGSGYVPAVTGFSPEVTQLTSHLNGINTALGLGNTEISNIVSNSPLLLPTFVSGALGIWPPLFSVIGYDQSRIFPILPTAAASISGFVLPISALFFFGGVFEKIIINVSSTFSLTLIHGAAHPTGIICPGGVSLVMAPGRVATISYNDDLDRWVVTSTN